jgi:hypothetical protein
LDLVALEDQVRHAPDDAEQKHGRAQHETLVDGTVLGRLDENQLVTALSVQKKKKRKAKKRHQNH